MGKITSYDLIIRHLGEIVYIVFIEDDEMLIKSGKLLEANPSFVVIKSDTLYKETNEIELMDGKLKKIIHFYNSLFIDLITAKEAIPLSHKLRKSDSQKEIISNLKPYLGNELAFIYKQNEGVSLATGKFLDMGVKGIKLSIAPFYNSEIILHYDKIIHIYDNRLVDLLKVESYKI